MRTIKGPAIFLAQFAGDKAPFDTLDNICSWAAEPRLQGRADPDLGQRSFIDVEKAATSKTYADELKGTAAKHGLDITELSSHIIGQLVAVHPAYDTLLGRLCAPGGARQSQGAPGMGGAAPEWMRRRPRRTSASTRTATFSGALAWPFSIRSRSVPPASSKKPSTNWPAAGRRSSTSSTSTASTSATRSIRARTCTTAPPTRCSSSA